MRREKEGEKAQNRKGRLKKLARTQPNSNIMEMESTENLSRIKQRLRNEEEAINEGRQKKLCTGESNPFDLIAVVVREHRRKP